MKASKDENKEGKLRAIQLMLSRNILLFKIFGWVDGSWVVFWIALITSSSLKFPFISKLSP